MGKGKERGRGGEAVGRKVRIRVREEPAPPIKMCTRTSLKNLR